MDDAEATKILKRDALGRVTFTGEQREHLLDEFERSGLKGKPFVRLAGGNYRMRHTECHLRTLAS